MREYPNVKHFTRENLQWPSLRSHPECSFKGSDARLILRWLIDYMLFRGVALDDVAQKALAAMKAVDDFLRLVFGPKDENGCKKALWDKTEASTAVELLTTYLDRSYDCAVACHRDAKCFFTLTPKSHYLQHVVSDLVLQIQNEDSDLVINPGAFATQMAEDATGRSCRMARTCHASTIPKRVAQKWLIATKLFWKE